MENVHLQVPEGFLEDEERCGYFVSSKMKKVWAVQMDMLCELDRICEKYGLTYYADSGTLIGAIRHKGFIPWDDDIDIAMMRSDFQKLLKVANKELKAPLFLQSVYSDRNYVRALARIRNSATTAIDKADLDKPFNHGIFIDIFPLDNVPENRIIRKVWCKKIRIIRRLLRNWAYYEITEKKSLSKKLFSKFLRDAVDRIGYKRVYRYLENVCGAFNKKRTKYVSYVSYSFGKQKHIWRRSLFDQCHKVPFEFVEINVPDGYDERLRVEYGEYMVLKNIPSTHGNVILEPDIPYKEYLKTHDAREELRKMAAAAEAEKKSLAEQPGFTVIEKPDWISYEEIADLLHDAHRSNVEKGMHFVASSQDGAETERRLGEEGKFFVALSENNELIGAGAIAFMPACKDWYGKGQACGEIKMVGVRDRYKGRGISSALYKALEEYGFSRCDLLVMNTARDNRMVLESNARHGWVYIDYKSWKKTDYYSVCMAKWKNGCPYNDLYRRLMFHYRKIYTLAVRRVNGELRFPLNMIKKERHIK